MCGTQGSRAGPGTAARFVYPVGLAFDPNLHEAVSQTVSADAKEGTVLSQIRRGYRLRDRLLRPSSVIVAAKPQPSDS